MTPKEYCQQRAAKSGSSFYYSFVFLPAPRRDAITALYAFCREVDDVVDDCQDLAMAQATLDWWRNEVVQVYHGTPTHPVGLALQPVVADYGLPQSELEEVIDGMEMDLQHIRYVDFDSLRQYCYKVASVVGRLAARIFGISCPETLRYSEKLGMAFQLTNIIRDVGEDARRGRIYLPMDDLQRFHVPAGDILDSRHSEAFVRLMQFQSQRALQYYTEAHALLPDEDRKNQRPGLVMSAIYKSLLDEIIRDNFRVLSQRISLTPLRKVWIAGMTWIRS